MAAQIGLSPPAPEGMVEPPTQRVEQATFPDASPSACHGRCFGHEVRREAWHPPRLAASAGGQSARVGYDTMSADEYLDTEDVLLEKVQFLAQLLRESRRCVIYSGAGLSTSAGIGDYASQASKSLSSSAAAIGAAVASPSLRSPMCAQPTLAHRVLVALHRDGRVARWINQNHDGLPQKAGLPQEAINEIHGAWHAPDNPVIPMSGSLREDLFADLLRSAEEADLVLALGTSLCGMNADRVATDAAVRAAAAASADGAGGGGASESESRQLGSVVIGLQRTVHDADSTLRIFGRCDEVFELLAREVELEVPAGWAPGEFFTPRALEGLSEEELRFEGLAYDEAGERLPAEAGMPTTTLDLREGADLVITGGMHAGARGEVDGLDREGNVRCRFMLRPKTGKLRAPVQLVLGRWWIQAAVDASVPRLPVVNAPGEASTPGCERLLLLMAAYDA